MTQKIFQISMELIYKFNTNILKIYQNLIDNL